MRILCAPAGWAILLLLVCCAAASAQVAPPTPQVVPPIPGITTTVPDLSMANTVTQLLRPAGATHVGEALGLATALQIGTAPLGASSTGFLIKMDPNTGLQVRTSSTFGPFFAESALTLGEGNIMAGVNFMSTTYDRLGTLDINALPLRSVVAAVPRDGRSGTGNLTLTANTLLVSARMGVTDNLDVGITLPIVTVKLNGTSSVANGNGDMVLFASGTGVASGLGDIAGVVKYRFRSFGAQQPDPGGLALMATMRLPTGDRESLRGLGVTRTLVQFIASSGQRHFRPHANGGFEYWSKGVGVLSDYAQNATVTARHQITYAGGFEYEAAPKVTLLVDLLGKQILGGGKVDVAADPTIPAGTVSSQSLVALPDGISSVSLAPGLKVNLKSKLLLSVNVLVALRDTGLHARVTPVAGLELALK